MLISLRHALEGEIGSWPAQNHRASRHTPSQCCFLCSCCGGGLPVTPDAWMLWTIMPFPVSSLAGPAPVSHHWAISCLSLPQLSHQEGKSSFIRNSVTLSRIDHKSEVPSILPVLQEFKLQIKIKIIKNCKKKKKQKNPKTTHFWHWSSPLFRTPTRL